MLSNGFDRFVNTIPKISRLVDQAKSGDVDAFIQLYDAYVEGIYRSVYLRVLNEAAAESITLQVFCNAWERFEDYQKYGLSFSTWIYKIARNQVTDYYKTNTKKHTIDVDFLSVAAFRGLNQDTRVRPGPGDRYKQARFLTADQQQTLISKYFNTRPANKNIAHIKAYLRGDVRALQMQALQTLATDLEDLDLEHEVKPSPTFIAYTRSWLTQYLRVHVRRPQSSPVSPSWRVSLAFSVAIVALLITGTAKAQSAMPGDPLYGWKRTSEQAWRAVSFDPVGTDITLVNRRLNEWIAVRNDPVRSATASNEYFDELARLSSTSNAVTRVRLIALLNTHRQRLNASGLSIAQLDNFLMAGAYPTTSITLTQISPTLVAGPATKIPTRVVRPPTEAPPNLPPPPPPPPPPEIPTAVVSPPTAVPPAVPTEIVPPATEVPTEVPPQPTAVSTEVVPPATEAPAPTEAPPPATEAPAPTDAPPPATEAPAPTDAPPPVAPTDVPADIPTGSVP